MLWIGRDREGLVLAVADVLLLMIVGDVDIHVLLILLSVVIHSQVTTHKVPLLILLVLSGVLHGGGIVVRVIHSRDVGCAHILTRYSTGGSPGLLALLKDILPTVDDVVDVMLGLPQHAH